MVTLSKQALILWVLGVIAVTGGITTWIVVAVRPADNAAQDKIITEKTQRPEAVEIVRTVEWYKAHPEEMKAVAKKCADNPGKLDQTPNCVNAKQALVQASSGKLFHVDW